MYLSLAAWNLVAAVLSAAPAVLASPTNLGTTFSVGVSRCADPENLSGLRETLLRHGRKIPPDLEFSDENPRAYIEAYNKACAADANCTYVPSSSGSNTSSATAGHEPGIWYTMVKAGESTLKLLVDTGSSDLWAFSALLPKNETTNHNLYNTSTGTRLPGYTFDIKYGDHTGASGIVYRDTVVIGNATVTSQAVEAATSVHFHKQPANVQYDGILGLSFERVNQVKPVKQKNFWENLLPSLKEPLFSLDFHYHGVSTIDFGYVDPRKYQGDIVYSYTKHFPNQFWWFNFTGYYVGEGEHIQSEPYNDKYPTGLLDTGTSFVLVAGDAAEIYFHKIKNAKLVQYEWVFPCDSYIPDFGYVINGTTFYIPGKTVARFLGEDLCAGRLFGSGYGNKNDEDAGDIIGAPFIASNIIVFDGRNKTIGFAERKAFKKNPNS